MWDRRIRSWWSTHDLWAAAGFVQTQEVLGQRLGVITQPGKGGLNTAEGTSHCFCTKTLPLSNSSENSKPKYSCSQGNECSSGGYTHLKPPDSCLLQTETFAFGISFFFSNFFSCDSFIRRAVVCIKNIILLIQKENWIIGAFYVSCCWGATIFKS